MAQVLNIPKGEAKVIHMQVRRVDSVTCDLTGYDSAIMEIYDDRYDLTMPTMTWNTLDSTRAIFYDRPTGQLEFFVNSSDTNLLDFKQYFMKVEIIKDTSHIYTIFEGLLQISR
jgi:imidazoleglycerol phosphate synthase glutamine amidotransferase subunit HisH